MRDDGILKMLNVISSYCEGVDFRQIIDMACRRRGGSHYADDVMDDELFLCLKDVVDDIETGDFIVDNEFNVYRSPNNGKFL